MKRSQTIELAGILLLSFAATSCFTYFMTNWGVVGSLEFSSALSTLIVAGFFVAGFTPKP